MEDIEVLLKKQNLGCHELDYLIAKIKENYWPNFKDNDIPQHCGLCPIFRFCKLINPELICPWLAK